MLTLQNTEAIRRIEEAIGYTFRDKRLLVQVLTRKTYLKIDPEAPDNEVLEFYGDTLMNYHVTNYFMSKYAHMLDDGLFFMRTVEQFTDMRSHYVCNRYLTDRVKALGLSRYLRAQNRDAELRRDSEKAYADIFESLVGAIYLDSYQNDALIRAFILRQLGIEPKRLPAEIESFDYDSLLDAPVCAPVDEAVGEPDEVAALAVTEADLVAEMPVAAGGEELEEIPAAEAVAEAVPAPAYTAEAEPAPVEVPSVEEASTPVDMPAAPTTHREKLTAYCEALGYEQPTYGETPKNAPNARPVAACTLKYRDSKGKLVKISLNDSGRTLEEATEKAAAKMLKKLEKQEADAKTKTATTEKAPMEEAPAESAPTVTEPVEEAVAEMAPVVETPAEEAPVEVTPVEVAPVEVAHVEVTPVEEAPVEVTPVEEAPVEVAPVEEAPVEEAPVEATAENREGKKAPAKRKSPAKKQNAESAEAATTADQPEKPKKPARGNSTRKKTAAKADKPVTEATAENSPAEAVPVPAAEESQPAKAKKTTAKRKSAPKKTAQPEATDSQDE